MDINEIKKWFGRIQRCEDLLATKSNERKQIIKLYKGEFFGSPIATNTEIVEDNFTFEYTQVAKASIYSKNPHIFVRTKNKKLGQFVETMEIVINHYWYEKKAKKKLKQAVMNAILQCPGFIEIGYFLFTEKDKAIQEIESEFPELKDINKKEETEEEQGIMDETIKEDDVFLNHVSPWNILFPDGYHEIRECPYLIKKQKITLEALLANPAYKKSKYKLRNRRTLKGHISSVTAYNMKALPKMENSGYSGMDD